MTSGHWLAGTRPVLKQCGDRSVQVRERSLGARRGITFCLGMETLPEPWHKQAFSLGLPLGGHLPLSGDVSGSRSLFWTHLLLPLILLPRMPWSHK